MSSFRWGANVRLLEMELALGGAAIVASGYSLPLLAGLVATKAVKGVVRKRQQDKRDAALGTNQGVTLEWTDLHLTLQQPGKDGATTRPILDGVSGTARPGRLLAVMGPSGAGKTSLLNALARQVPYSAQMQFTGTIEINGVSVKDDDAFRQAYVQQEDLFYSQLTLRETLTMACALRLPADLPKARRDALVSALIDKLGLTSCADTYVGDAATRGLSGGEKKRLSIGCELLNSPALMFLDEPTTGLDAFQAEKVMDALKRLANDGHTIICSIHQPRSSVFAMFDDLILMAEGRVVYCGATENAIGYFVSFGYRLPEHYNPAEYFADLISVDTSTPETKHETEQRVTQLIDKWRTQPSKLYLYRPSEEKEVVVNGVVNGELVKRSSWFRDFRLLLGRSWKQARRDKKTNVARLGMNVGSALIFGGIYFKMKVVASMVQDRVGLLQLAAVNTAMSALVKTVNIFPSEQTIVTRERAKKSYGVMPYLFAKVLSEIPVGMGLSAVFGGVLYTLTGLNPSQDRLRNFLAIVVMESFASASLGLTVGSLAPNTEVAVGMGPMVMLLFIVFGGQFKNSDTTAKLMSWVPNASLIQNGFQAMCINEFKDLEFDDAHESHKERAMMKTGNEVLAWLGFGEGSIKEPLVRNAKVILFNYWLTYNILRAKKPKFTPLQSPGSS